MNLSIPELSLVVLVGATGSGKSSFARRHFKPTEVITSDFCRALVADDENDQSVTADAFDVLYYVAGKRLKAGRLTVIDATNTKPEDRKHAVELARQHHVLPIAIVLDLPEEVLHARGRTRTDRDLSPHVIHRQHEDLRRGLRNIKREGFNQVFMLKSPAEIEAAAIERVPSWTNRRHEHGPFDLIGDVHGCLDEALALLAVLGYDLAAGEDGHTARHPQGRRAIFLGDLVDRGPNTPGVLKLVMNMVAAGAALWVPGNHDDKLKRALQGRKVQVSHGLAESLAQLADEPPAFRERVTAFIDGLIGHLVLDDGNLVVAHAGMKEEMQGRASARCRDFALYGETTGETDEFGLPVRYNWAREYRGKAMVAYGHTPVPQPEWLNNTIDLDTGCVFGGRLTALRYPERELVSVPAARTYYEPARPFLPPGEAAPHADAAHEQADLLDVADVTGKRIITTPLAGNVTVREENAAAALEIMSRFAVDPRWLVYLPPTMSPTETSKRPDLLEHPAEAFAYFRHQGVPRVVCEQKHMGSRAVVVVCRNESAAARRFGIGDDGAGVIFTRTGRRFFDERALETAVLARVRAAISAAGWWTEFASDWFVLDCELMPWSAKAQELLRRQYAAVGAAGQAALRESVSVLEQAADSGRDVAALLSRFRERGECVSGLADAYRRYCWPVQSIADLKLASFHLLASEERVHTDRDHVWHMQQLAALCRADDGLLLETPYRIVDMTDAASEQDGVAWWEELTAAGGEGMVVKPLDFAVRSARGLVQPAVKCRGREYLRIIYGPEYTRAENLERLRSRSVGAKRGLALREFALGVEALQRFVRREPLHRVHECVFAVLALESEPVDPRL